MIKTIIKGTGRYVPKRVVTNRELEKYMDTNHEWIVRRTGIEQRHWVEENEDVGTSDLGYRASLLALEKSGWDPRDLDLIIFATLSPDYFFPGSGCLMQHKLGLRTTPAIDIRQQCTGFIYGLAVGDAFIKSGQYQKILLVGSEIHSRGLDISDEGRDVAVLFGDGAGAVCLEAIENDENVGVLGTILHSRGELAKKLMIEVPSFRKSPYLTEKLLKEKRHYPRMDGRTIFEMAIEKLPEVTQEVLRKNKLQIEDIDMVIPHQANIRINKIFQDELKIPDDKIYNNINKYGNTTAASIPIALDEIVEKKMIKKGYTILFVALGSGVTWGSALYRFQ